MVGRLAARRLHPASKLATTRRWTQSTLAQELGLEQADADDLYTALDWLYEQQPAIEAKLTQRYLGEGGLVFYDLSSSYVTGRHCPLAQLGYSRDGKRGTLQVTYGLIATGDGLPLAVEAFAGNTQDSSTVLAQVDKLQQRYGLKHLVLVGDRGMLTTARVDELRARGLGWITALRAPQIQALVGAGTLQLGLFDERNLAEITDPPHYPQERLIVCRNPLLAQERARKREDLVRATEAKLQPVLERVAQGRLRGKDAIGLAVGKVIDRHKVGKHFRWRSRRPGSTFAASGRRSRPKRRWRGSTCCAPR